MATQKASNAPASRQSTPVQPPGQPWTIRQVQEFAAQNAVTSVLAGLSALVSVGTLFSLLWNTSLHTSSYTAPVPKHRTTFLANKNNFLNTYFVKIGWGWTMAFFLLHSLTNPRPNAQEPLRRTRIKRFLKLGIATLIWFIFNRWLNTRVFQYSGGECLLQLPEAYPTLSAIVLPEVGQRPVRQGYGGSQWLPVNPSLCQGKQPVPEGIVSTLIAEAADDSFDQALAHLKASNRGGFDISGHVFMLILAAALIYDDLAPTHRTFLRQGMAGLRKSWTGWSWHWIGLDGLVKLMGTVMLGLCAFMLVVTSIYFHSPSEKFSGIVVAAWASYSFKFASEILTPIADWILSPLLDFVLAFL